MKKTHIFLIVVIAIAIGAILATFNNTSSYANFTEAMASPNSEFHVVGKHSKNKESIYNPEKNANEFSFYMIDNQGIEKRVILYKPKPQDFERAEQIVLIGKMKEGTFHASEILMKCPSKYNDGKPQ